ncbi:tail protein [Vibrio phage D69]
MASINFPNSPATGTVYNFGDYRYTFDGTKWTSVVKYGSSAVKIQSATAPAAPEPGLQWFDDESGRTYFWHINEGSDQGQWVEDAPQGVVEGEEVSEAFVTATGSNTPRTVGDRFADFVNVMDFGAVGDGSTDDTAAIQAAIDYAQSTQGSSKAISKVVFAPLTYNVTGIKVDDLYDTTIDLNGALIKGVARSPTTAVFWFFNYNNIKIHGGTIYSFNNTNYTYGMLFNGGSGGTIDPGVGLGKEMLLSNMEILRFARGIKIGHEGRDTNHGQNSIVNTHVKECNQGIIVAGSQTIVSVSGGSTSGGGADYGIADIDKQAVQSLGGAVTLNSTEILKTSGLGYGIGLSNCDSATYDNQYGSVIVNGCYLETTSLARIFQSGSAASRTSSKSALIISNTTGGSGGASRIQIVCNADDYAGRITCRDGNYYGFGGTRTAPAIDVGNSDAYVSLGRNFFQPEYFKSNLEEVVGGIMALDNDLITRVENLAGQSITTAGGTLEFDTVYQNGRFDRYKNSYDPTTGVFTVPKGGLLQATFELGITSNTFDGVVRLLKNGIAAYNFYTSVRMDFSTTLFDLDEGDTVEVRVEPSSNVTFGTSATDYMQVTATR